MVLDVLGYITVWLFIGIIVYEISDRIGYKVLKEEWKKEIEKIDSITYLRDIASWPVMIYYIISILYWLYKNKKSKENSKEL